MIEVSAGAVAVAAPGPSCLISSLIAVPCSHWLRNSVRADETEVDVHEEHDQRGQDEDVKSEEALQRRRAYHRAALQQLLHQRADSGDRNSGRDLDGDLGREVR